MSTYYMKYYSLQWYESDMLGNRTWNFEFGSLYWLGRCGMTLMLGTAVPWTAMHPRETSDTLHFAALLS
jgi:hypothetical protein